MQEHVGRANDQNPDCSKAVEKPIYCYACRREHPPGHPMRRVETRYGYRWRCQATLDAARLDPATRDALGRAKSEANRMFARRAMEHFNRNRALLLGG